MSGSPRELQLTARSGASPEAVFDTLVDIRTHLDWAGRRQRAYFRLLSLEAADFRLAVGASFASTGSIPGTGRQFHDQSRVTAAERPFVVEFVTEATVSGRRPMQATFRHRYELEPDGAGCRVRYTFREEKLVNPMLRLSVPIVRTLTWKVGMPMMMGRGLRNMTRAAEQHAAAPLTVGGVQ